MTDTQRAVAEDIKKKIVRLVRAIEDTYFIGVKYSNVSQRFLKRAQRYNLDLLLLIEELRESGELYTYMNEKGTILLMAPEIKEQITEDDFGLLTQESQRILSAKWGNSNAKEN